METDPVRKVAPAGCVEVDMMADPVVEYAALAPAAPAVDYVAPATVQVGEHFVAVSPAAHAADTRIDDIGEKLTNMINMLGPKKCAAHKHVRTH